MSLRRVHVVKVPTTVSEVFPYSHYADEGHDPKIEAVRTGNEIVLTCSDLFKFW